MKNAIILCSGGLDSVTVAHNTKENSRYNKIKILFFNYNQRNLKTERSCSQKCAKDIGAEFQEIPLKFLSEISTSMLNTNKPAKFLSHKDLKDTSEESMNWYVPCRNAIFLNYATALAEANFIRTKVQTDIITGFKCEGQEAYPDTTPEFVEHLNTLNAKTTLAKTKILAPLIKKDKEDIIKLGQHLGVDFTKTHTCYNTEEIHCGHCISCKLRQEGFYWAGIKDPTNYKTPSDRKVK